MNPIQNVVAKAASWMLKKSIGDGVYLSSGSSYPMNWWQMDLPEPRRHDASVFGPLVASKLIVSQDISRIPLRHIRERPDGSIERVDNKAPARLLSSGSPNHYQTTSDFLLNLVTSLLADGNAYALAERNDRNEVSALYPIPPGTAWPYVGDAYDEFVAGDVYYQVGNSAFSDMTQIGITDGYLFVPARNMFHQRLATPRHPLIGESALVAAYAPQLTGSLINEHTAKFFQNMGRPSGVLRMPGALKEPEMKRVKEEWKRITQGVNFGEVAVLCNEMKWEPIELNAVDAELVKIFNLQERQVFQLLRVPPYLYGDTEKSVFREVESVLRFYYQTCLAYYITAIEQNLTKFFRLPSNEKIQFEFDTALLQTDFRQRMDAYAKAIQSGVFSPNEARAQENLGPVEFGDDPRVQQQLVPLSYGAGLQPPGQAETPPPSEEERAAQISTLKKKIRQRVKP